MRMGMLVNGAVHQIRTVVDSHMGSALFEQCIR